MSCKICGKSSCCESFHSAEVLEAFNDVEERVKRNLNDIIQSKIYRLDGHYHGNNLYIKKEDVDKIINDVLY